MLASFMFVGIFLWKPTDSSAQTTKLDFLPYDSEIDAKEDILYMTDKGKNMIYRNHYKTGKVDELILPYPAENMTLYDGKLYVTQLKQKHTGADKLEKGAIAVIDTKTFKVDRIIHLNQDPFDMAIDKDGFLYVTPGSGEKQKIHIYNLNDGDKEIISSSNYRSLRLRRHIIYNQHLSKLYYPQSANLFAIEVEKGELKNSYEWKSGFEQYAWGVDITPDEKYIYTNDGGYSLASNETEDLIRKVKFDEGYDSFAFSNDYTFGISSKQGIDVYTYGTSDYLYTLYGNKNMIDAFADDGLVSIENIDNKQAVVHYDKSVESDKLGVATIYSGSKYSIDSPFNDNEHAMPTDLAFTVYMNEKITALDPSKVIVKSDSGKVVPITVTYNKNVIQITMDPLEMYTNYTLTFEKSAVSGYQSNPNDSDIIYHFKTKADRVKKVDLSLDDKEAPIRYNFSAQAEGGTDVEYQFLVSSESGYDERVVQPYSDKKTFVFEPNSSGKYQIIVQARSKESGNIYDEKNRITVNPIDDEAPTLNVKEIYNRDENTMTLDITANDNVGIKTFTLPNSLTVSGNHATYTMKKNGSYHISVEDYFGHIVKEDGFNASIDTDSPKISSSLSTTKNTKNDVKVTIKATDYVGIKKLTLPDGKTTTNATTTFTATKNGTYKIIAEDYAKHKKTHTFVVKNIFKKAPKTPTSVTIDDNKHTIKGNAEPYTDVIVKAPKYKSKIVHVSNNGTFSYVMPKLKARTKVAVYGKNQLGQKGKTITVTVKDKTGPWIYSSSIKGKTVTINTEPKAKIYIYKNKKKIKTLMSSSNGTAKGTIPLYKIGTQLEVYLIDTHGNKSTQFLMWIY